MDLSKPLQRSPVAPCVSVVIPVLNEAGTLVATLESLSRAFPAAGTNQAAAHDYCDDVRRRSQAPSGR